MNKNKLSLGLVLALVMLVGIAVGSVTVHKANAAANVANVADISSTEGFYYLPMTIKWPLSTDTTEVVTLNANYGRPIGYRQIQFQDQDLPAGGYADDATQGSGAVAEELENIFIIFEEYGGASLAANQITVYRQEFDGSTPTTDSVVSWGEFIFSPIDNAIFPSSY